MTIDYKKLLPSYLRENRWGEFIEALQGVLGEVKTDKVDIIETQYQIEQMTTAQIASMRNWLGYNYLTYADGWTSNSEYLKRQILTVIPRILNRNTKTAYEYLFYIFNLIADVYPMYWEESEQLLYPLASWWVFDEEAELVIDTIDAGEDNILYYDGATPVYDTPAVSPFTDQYLDTDSFPTLDLEPIRDKLTRHFIIPHRFRYVESATEFMTENTLNALFEDVKITKRRTELPYFEPICYVNCSGVASGSRVVPLSGIATDTTEEWYYDFDASLSGVVESLYFGSDSPNVVGLSGVSFVEFGTGGHDPITYDISGVANTIVLSGVADGRLDVSNMSGVVSETEFNMRRNITQKCTWGTYSEMALKDANSGVILYSKFPEITYLEDNSQYYSNVQLDINLV